MCHVNHFATEFFDAISKNNTVHTLIMDYCSMNQVSITSVGHMLTVNNFLRTLCLRGNQINDLNSIAEELIVNSTLTCLNLDDNHINDIDSLSHSLTINNTLQSLDMPHCRINEAGINKIAECLRLNNSLRKLSIDYRKNISDIISISSSLEKLYIKFPIYDRTPLVNIAEGLRTNYTLTDLPLPRNYSEKDYYL